MVAYVARAWRAARGGDTGWAEKGGAKARRPMAAAAEEQRRGEAAAFAPGTRLLALFFTCGAIDGMGL